VLAVDRLVFVTATSDVVTTFCSPCVSGVVLAGIVVGVLVVAVHDLWVYARIIVVMSRNSVLEEFSVRRFAVFHRTAFDLQHSEVHLCWSRSESEGRKGRVECHLRGGDGLENKRK